MRYHMWKAPELYQESLPLSFLVLKKVLSSIIKSQTPIYQAIFKDSFFGLCVEYFSCMCVSVPPSCDAHGGQKRASELWGLELQKAVSWELWKLGTEPGSSAHALLSHLSSSTPGLFNGDFLRAGTVKSGKLVVTTLFPPSALLFQPSAHWWNQRHRRRKNQRSCCLHSSEDSS